ncbi:MAG: flagellin, partial [Candidatus Riflebacteria bacterium]|nr:flagellin [Candidatus Riflebacteria bacterium]
SANDTLTTTDRLEIQKEIAELKEDIDRISYDTEFNTKKLLDGTGTAVVSTSDTKNIDAIVTDQVLTFSDFSVAVWIKSEYVAGEGQKTYYGAPEQQRSAIFLKTDGSIAEDNTMLMSISNFVDNNGNFILEDAQTLYIQGDNSQGSLEVSKGLTLSQLSERIKGSMTTDQLGHGLNFEGSESVLSTSGEHAGQITVTSGRNGVLGRVSFTGSEDLVKALGFEVITEPEDPIYSVAVTNIGVPYGERQTLTTQVSGHRVGGLIEGIELAFEPPQVAHVESTPAVLGITIAAPIAFTLTDSVPNTDGTGLTSDAVNIPAGNFSMDQVVSIINSQLTVADLTALPLPVSGSQIKAQISQNGGVEFVTINSGSSAWVEITGIAGSNELGIVNGTYYGTGGTAARTTAFTQITDFDYAAPNNADFSIADSHGNFVTVTLNQDYDQTGDGLNELVSAINGQLSAVAIVAEVKDGLLSFKSKETGYGSGFVLTASVSTVLSDRLKINSPTASGIADGSPVSQPFAYNDAFASYGYVIAGASPANDLVFNLADLNGKVASVTIPSGGAGSSFITVNSIANEINNTANANSVQITANIDNDTHRLALVSSVPGSDGKVTLANAGATGSLNNLYSVLGITASTYENGVGNYAYNVHLKNTSIQLQVGPNEGDTARCHIARIDCMALGIRDLDLTTPVSATRAITLIDTALNKVNSERARLGAVENRLSYTSNSLSVSEENMTAAESRIRDCDMASEVIKMTQSQILQQASNAMVAQANSSAQSVLELLR